METGTVLQAIFSLFLVLGLIGMTAILYKKYILDKNLIKGGKPRRLIVEEQLYLDAKRRLILVKKDSKEYLILLGQNGETVVSSDQTLVPDAEVQEISAIDKPFSLKNIYSRKKS